MLKRIFIIALFTGLGQLFIVFALKYISHHSTNDQLNAIAQIDSLILFLTNAIALGLQPAAMRNLALNSEWKDEYKSTQSARLTLSLFLTMLALLAFFNKNYLAFIFAPLLALSGDYAIYGRGYPVKGAMISLIRSIIPFSLIILFLFYKPESIAWVYLAGLLFTYFVTNILISKYLDVPFFSNPRWDNLKLYINTLSLGLVSLGLYFIGMGVILIAPYFYNNTIVAAAFVGLKFYVIFKGVLRIIQQAFLKEMVSEDIGLKIDQIGSLLGLSFAVFIICFPNTFISLFFGNKYLPDKTYFILLGISALVYSLFSSFTTRAMLEKKDNLYAKTTLSAAIFTLLICVVLSYSWQHTSSIGISIVSGELFFATGMLILMNRKTFFQERIRFFFKSLLFVIIPVGAVFLFADNLIPFLVSLSIYGVFIFIFSYKKFN